METAKLEDEKRVDSLKFEIKQAKDEVHDVSQENKRLCVLFIFVLANPFLTFVRCAFSQ
jgi:hypothetical protein